MAKCPHPEVTERSRNYAATRNQPAETETVFTCSECGRELDFSDVLELDGIIHAEDPASLRAELRRAMLIGNPEIDIDEADAIAWRRVKK